MKMAVLAGPSNVLLLLPWLRQLQVFCHVELVGARDIVDSSNSLLCTTNDGSILDFALTADELLIMAFRHFQVTSRRNTIYVLLSLASNGHLSTVDNKRRSSMPC